MPLALLIVGSDTERINMEATDKQRRYALFLIGKAGFNTVYMDSKFKDLGATMHQRSGRVSDWIGGMNSAQCSELIDKLKLKV